MLLLIFLLFYDFAQTWIASDDTILNYILQKLPARIILGVNSPFKWQFNSQMCLLAWE